MSESRPKMRLRVHGVSNSLWNKDLAPVPRDERTWGASRYLYLLAAMSVCIPTYLLASGLIALGMNGKEALGTMLLGNVIVLVPMVLNAHAGAKYGIPFPVYVRASFGVLGASVPAMLRALVGCGWFGIQCWIGGEALFCGAKLFTPGIGDGAIWWCFAAFWLLNMAVVWIGIERIKSLQAVSAPFMLIVGSVLLFSMVGRAGGFGVVLTRVGSSHGGDPAWNFWKIFVPSLTGVVGFWSAVALNVPDFTRYARSQRAQVAGQAIGLPVGMFLYSFLAVAVTAATVIVTPDHRAIWNPIELIASFQRPAIALIGLALVLLATLAANGVACAANAFSGLRPKLISVRMGGLIVGVVGIAWMPWRLVTDPERYIDGWLVGCSGLLGPVAGIMIADYFLVRRRSLDVDELYVRGGVCEYAGGFNRRALIALVDGIVVALVGLFVPRLHWLYEYAWFVGFGVSAVVYLVLMSAPDVRAMIPPNPLLLPVDGLEAEPMV